MHCLKRNQAKVIKWLMTITNDNYQSLNEEYKEEKKKDIQYLCDYYKKK